MRDLSNLLWCDLTSDEERLEFIRSGRAVETGIVASVMVEDLVAVFQELLLLQALDERITNNA